jgi:hypothetical protein
MAMDPTYFIDLGMRSLMRHPFFNLTRLSLQEGECDFHLLENREGLIVTLGPNTSIFDRPSSSVCRWPGTKTIPRQSPHPAPQRSWIKNELSVFLHILCGGGDVKFNRITTLGKQREILLTAGDGNVVEKIDLMALTREGVPPLQFLQPAYLCSSANLEIQSVPCDASTMSWARAPYVYKMRSCKDAFVPAILCLSGRTMVWCERLKPSESRDFALGNVIAATTNITSKLRPTSQCHPEDYEAPIFDDDIESDEASSTSQERQKGRTIRAQIREFASASKTLLDSVRAREGFFVCELTNHSDKPAYVFIQLNRSGYYGGSGLVGLVIKMISVFFRLPHWSTGG